MAGENKNNNPQTSTIMSTAIIALTVVLAINLVCCYKFILDVNNLNNKSQEKIEQILNTSLQLKKQSADTYKIVLSDTAKQTMNNKLEENKKEFMTAYYTAQSNWLNAWLTILTIVLGVLALIFPILFMKLHEDKKEEMDKIIDECREKTKKSELNVDKMQEQLDKVLVESGKVSDELKEVKEYVSKAKESENRGKVSAKFAQAMAEYNNKKYDEAKKSLEEVLALDSKNSNAYVYLALIYQEEKEYIKSKEYLEKVLEIAGKMPSGGQLLYLVFSCLGIAEFKLGNYKKAVECLEKSLKIRKREIVLYNISEAYIFNGQPDKAVESLKEFMSIKDGSYIYEDDLDSWIKEIDKAEESETKKELLSLVKKLTPRKR